MTDIVPFDFEGHHVRVIWLRGDPWWVAMDVCAVLGLVNVPQAMSRLRPQQVCLADVLAADHKMRQTNVISEAGLYRLIMRSDKEVADRFQDWLAEEVLPALRKTGTYSLATLTPGELLLKQAQQYVELERRQAAVERGQAKLTARVDGLEHNTGWSSALGFAKYIGLVDTSNQAMVRLGKHATSLLKQVGRKPRKTRDQRFGECDLYPEEVLQQAVIDLDMDLR